VRLRRVVVGATITVLAGSVLTIVTASGPPGTLPKQVPIAEAPNHSSASLAAHRQGTRVEVLDQRGETRTVYADPKGGFTAEFTVVPIRARRGNAWVPIDKTLEQRPDGSIGPKGAVGDLVLSGGGTGPLATLSKAGRSIALSWPGALPKPTLSENRATYPDVLPGVDLVMLAEINGYQQHLMVKTPEAAKNPALASIKLAITANGLKVSVDDDGAIHVVDEAGTELFTAPPSEMWDSAEHRAKVGVSVVDDSLVLTPDQKFLADPAMRYPVTIDPFMVTHEKSAWATALSGKPTDKYWWKSGAGSDIAQVGQCYNDGTCNNIGEAYFYFQFDTTGFGEVPHYEATLNTTIRHSPKCTSGDVRKHHLHRATNFVTSGLTWNNKPGLGWGLEFDAPVSCGNWQPVGFSIPVGEVIRNNHSPFVLKAASGTDQIAWRKYVPAETKLSMRYNRAPNKADNMVTDPRTPDPCRWCGGTAYLSDSNIRLIANAGDPDGDGMDVSWAVKRNGALIWETGWLNDWQQNWAFHDRNYQLGAADQNQLMSWGVAFGDGAGWSDYRWTDRPFVYDPVRPNQVPTVHSALYPEDNRWHGGVGVADTFVFGSQGVSDIDRYRYSWDDGPTTEIPAESRGGPARVALAPTSDGPRALRVQSIDLAGNESDVRTYRFYARAGNGPRSQWSLEGNTNDTAFLGDRHGTLNGGATFGPGAVGTGIELNGSGHVSAPATIRNDAPFSVSAWVNIKDPKHPRAAVSQDGGPGAIFPGFALWHRAEPDGSDSKWTFGVPYSAMTDRGAAWASSPVGMPQANVWTHLTGVHDPWAKQIRLYVNGSLVASAPFTGALDIASGPVRIGQLMWGAGRPAVDTWFGGVDEVQLHDRVLSEQEIAAMVSSSGVQVAHWKMDEESGATARNSVEGGPDALLENGASFTEDGAVDRGVHLDGQDDRVSTAGPILRTDQSFSVAAQVKFDRVDNGTYTVLSQDGEKICGFCLQLQGNQWVFVFPQSDEDTPKGYDWVGTPATPSVNEWTHLVGTYDATARMIRMYINGNLIGEKTVTVAWSARRSFRIGASSVRGNVGQHFPGTVDEVRVFSRAISEDEVRGILSKDNVTAGTWRLDGDPLDENGNLNGTLQGGADWTAGQTSTPNPKDLAARFNGTSSFIGTPRSAVDTDRSFAVAAWARLDKIGGNAAVVAQEGNTYSGFILKALPNGRWAFVTPTSDGGTVGGDVAESGSAAQAGVWTHLVGMYSKDRQRIELYVNGVLAGSAPHTTVWDANGPVVIGRSKWKTGSNGDGKADWFTGAVDDVVIYSRTLFINEIQALASRDLSLGHNWTMDEGKGATVADAVGARPGKLAAGASFTAGRASNGIALDGVDDVITTTGVDVRTDRSFTVSAWVNLQANDCDLTATSKCFVSAVSLDGDSQNANAPNKFRLGHVIDRSGHSRGNWIFEMPESDGTVTEAAIEVRPGQLNTWVHLVGTYDTVTKAIWIYVNGVEKDDGTMLEPWQATGGLRIGSNQVSTGAPRFFKGKVDEFRMYSGALTDQQVSGLYASYPQEKEADTVPIADAGYWKFDEETGTTAVDSGPRGLTATMRGGAGWTNGRSGSTAWFDGTTGYAETAGPVVDNTSESFTVAGWASLTNTTKNATVFGQDGTQQSVFSVQYDAAIKKWVVVVPRPNQPDLRVVASEQVGPDWTHLTVVYDSDSSQLWLYVNGAPSGVETGVSIQPADGPFSFGRGKRGGANVDFFPRGVDDVRVFRTALTRSQVRRVHDDVYAAGHGHWRFDDGTVRDYSWRNNPTTASATGTSFTTGMLDKGLQLDGVSGALTATYQGTSMRDSFTVSAWAKLSRLDKPATILGQDGDWQSAYALQFRPEAGRWTFGAAQRDAKDAPMNYVNSLLPPTANMWTHLTGVYDYPARQLRIYVNGQLVGSKNNVLLWTSLGGFTIGRSKVNGNPAEFFPGTIDDVSVELGALAEDKIAIRAGWATPSGGQLGRFDSLQGDHRSAYSTTDVWSKFGGVPVGYRYEGPLGAMLSSEQPGTRRLYSCLINVDAFTSTDPGCEGKTKLADLGWVYTEPQTDRTTSAMYRCIVNDDRFDSLMPNCEGKTPDTAVGPGGLLGYTLAYVPLTRYYHPQIADHRISAIGGPPGYYREGTLGIVAGAGEPGTVMLWSCADGTDQFLSVEANCEGKTVQGSTGRIWAEQPAGKASRQLFKCAVRTTGQRFVSVFNTCEDQTVVGPLGWVLTVIPGPTPS
jgi:hypothetical protein